MSCKCLWFDLPYHLHRSCFIFFKIYANAMLAGAIYRWKAGRFWSQLAIEIKHNIRSMGCGVFGYVESEWIGSFHWVIFFLEKDGFQHRLINHCWWKSLCFLFEIWRFYVQLIFCSYVVVFIWIIWNIDGHLQRNSVSIGMWKIQIFTPLQSIYSESSDELLW